MPKQESKYLLVSKDEYIDTPLSEQSIKNNLRTNEVIFSITNYINSLEEYLKNNPNPIFFYLCWRR